MSPHSCLASRGDRMKSTWFHHTDCSTEQADELVKRYKARGVRVERSLKPVVTRVGFNANQFVLMSGSGDTQYSPFAVVNGQVFISSAFIQDGTITNAKIGNFIQSNNYVAGQSGWKLDKGGTWENYGSDGQGARKTTNVTDSIRDANGVLRVQIGKLTGVF